MIFTSLDFYRQGYSLSDSSSEEQKSTSKAFHGVALCCNISTIIYYVVAALAFIIAGGTSLGLWLRYRNYYDDYYYGGCYDDCSTPQYSTNYDGTTSYDGCSTICIN